MNQKFSLRAAAIAMVGIALLALACLAPSVPIHTDTGLQIVLAGLVVNRDSLNAMYNGFNAAFNDAFAGVQPMWQKVATEVPSTAKVENYGWLGEFPQLR